MAITKSSTGEQYLKDREEVLAEIAAAAVGSCRFNQFPRSEMPLKGCVKLHVIPFLHFCIPCEVGQTTS